MAGNGQMNRQTPYRPSQTGSSSQTEKAKAIDNASQRARRGSQTYSLTLDLGQAQYTAAQNLTYGISRKPDMLMISTLSPEAYGLKQNDETLEYAGRIKWMIQTSVDSDLNPHLENLQIGISGNREEFEKKFEHLKGKSILSPELMGSKSLEITDMDNYNNRELYPGGMGLSYGSISSVHIEKAIIGDKYVRTPSEKAMIVINSDDTNKETDMATTRGKGFLKNVSGGPYEISPQSLEVYRFYNAYNIQEFSAYMAENGQNLQYINSQFAKISAYEQEKVILLAAKQLYGDSAVLNNPGTQFVDKMGYLRDHHSDSFEELKQLADRMMQEYSISKELTIKNMDNYREPDPKIIADVKQSTIQITDQVIEGADFQRRIAPLMSEFRESFSNHKIEELELALDKAGSSKALLAPAVEFDIKERLEKEKRNQEYIQTLATFHEAVWLYVKDKNDNNIDDRYEILKECGFSAPEKIDSLSLDDLNIQIENVTREACKIAPASADMTRGIEENEAVANKAENIKQLLEILAKLQETHPENFAVDTKNLYEYGVHDRLTVDVQTMDSISKLKEGINIPALRNITYETLASKESCEAARDALQKYIDEELRVAYHKDGRISKLETYQTLVESIDVQKYFKEYITVDESSKELKIDFSRITDEDIKKASSKLAADFEETDKSKTIILETAIRAKLAVEILDQHSHSQDYAFNPELVRNIINEDNKTIVLKYAAEHLDEIQKIRNDARGAGLSTEETLDRIERHLAINCNIPPDEMHRLRQVTNESNTLMQSDFLRSETFIKVSTDGVPPGTTFRTFSEVCGIKDLSQLENPADVKQFILRLDDEIAEMKGLRPVGDKGATTFADDGRLSVFESIRNTMVQHAVGNNLEQLKAQTMEYEYNPQILQNIRYTREEQTVLANNHQISKSNDLSTAYGVYLESQSLSERDKAIKSAIDLLEGKISENKKLEVGTKDITIISDALKAGNLSPDSIKYQTPEEMREAIAKFSEVRVEMSEAKSLLDSKLHPVVKDKTAEGGIRAIEYHPTAEQKTAIGKVEEFMAQKEDFIKYAINFENKEANFSEIIKAYEKQNPESPIFKDPKFEAFLEKAEGISWREIHTYTSFTETNPSFTVEKSTPVLLSAATSAYEVQNPQVAMLFKDDMAEITRLADKSIQQDIFRENILQACRENPGVDIRRIDEFQEGLATKIKAEIFSDMLYTDENGKSHWRLAEKVDFSAYDKISAEEILKVREEVKASAAEQIKEILKDGEIKYSVDELKTLKGCKELEHLFDKDSKITTTPEILKDHDGITAELEKLKQIENPSQDLTAAIGILESKNKLNYGFESSQQELQSVGTSKFGSMNLQEMMHSETSTAKTIFEMDKEITNIQYTKLVAQTVELAGMQKDLETLESKMKELKSLQEEKEAAASHSHEKASWKERWANYFNHGKENEDPQLKKNSPEQKRIDGEIAKVEGVIKDLKEKYGMQDRSNEEFATHLSNEIRIKEDFKLQIDKLEVKYSGAVESTVERIDSRLQELGSKSLEDWTKEDKAFFQKWQTMDKEALADLASKPLATWTKDDRALFVSAQEFDHPLIRKAFEKQLDQDVETARAYTECKALTSMKNALESVQETRQEHGLTHHEVTQVNHQSIGERVSANEANTELENLRNAAREAERAYTQLTELRHHTETVLSTSGSEHERKVNLESIKLVTDAHASFASAATAYNEALIAHQQSLSTDGRAVSMELPVYTAEAVKTEEFLNKLHGKGAGTTFDREEPIIVPEIPEVFRNYVHNHEASHEYREVFKNETLETTADMPNKAVNKTVEAIEEVIENDNGQQTAVTAEVKPKAEELTNNPNDAEADASSDSKVVEAADPIEAANGM